MAWTERFVDAAAVGGGTGTSAGDPWTLDEALSNSAAGMRVNFKAGSYVKNTLFTGFLGGTAASPVWWRGYKTTIGDLDDIFTEQKVDGSDLPLVTVTGQYINEKSGNFNLSSMSFVGQSTGRPAIYLSGTHCRIWNCKFVYDLTSGGTVGCIRTESDQSFTNCLFQNKTGSSQSVVTTIGFSNAFNYCKFTGANCHAFSGSIYGGFTNCIFDDLGYGLSLTGRHGSVTNCTFNNITSDAITISAGAESAITFNYFANVTGNAITSSASLSTALIQGNIFQNVGSQLNNIFENLQVSQDTDASDKFIDSASGDFTLDASSNGYSNEISIRGAGANTYRDIGAIQHAEPSGGGNVIVIED